MAITAIGQSTDTAQPRQVANGGNSIREHLMAQFGLMLDQAQRTAAAGGLSVGFGIRPELAACMTPFERRVLDRLVLGEGNQVIAYEAGVSEATVKAHIRKVSERFGTTNRTLLALVLVGAVPVPARAVKTLAEWRTRS